MSITFTALDSVGRFINTGDRLEPCLCAQDCDAFGAAMDLGPDAVYTPEMLADLHAAAWGGCSICKGTGVEALETDLDFNASNVNAIAMLRAIGLIARPYGVQRLDVLSMLVAPLARENARTGLDATDAPSVVYQASGNVLEGTSTPDGHAARLARFAEFLDTAKRAGAVSISWG